MEKTAALSRPVIAHSLAYASLILWLAYSLLHTGLGMYPLDDAYIVKHSVDGLLSGSEDRFTESTPWLGVTSPIFVGAVVLLAIPLSIDIAQWTVISASAFLFVAGIIQIGKTNSLNPWMTLAVVILTLSTPLVLYQLGNGLETGLAMAAVTWVIVGFSSRQPPLWAYILLAALPFIRPDLGVISIVVAAYAVYRRPDGWRPGILAMMATGTLLAALVLALTESIIPGTASAKVYFFAEGCLPHSKKSAFVITVLIAGIQAIGLFSLGFVGAAISRLWVVVLLTIALFVLAYTIKFPGALAHNYFRYLYVLIPFAVFGWVSALVSQNELVRRSAWVAAMVTAILASINIDHTLQFLPQEVTKFTPDNREAALWVSSNAPTEAVVMVHDAGMASLYGDQKLVDLVGLKSPESARIHKASTYAVCRRSPKAIARIASLSGASYFIVLNEWDSIFRLSDSLRYAGWSVVRADVERGDSHYRVYRIEPPAVEAF